MGTSPAIKTLEFCALQDPLHSVPSQLVTTVYNTVHPLGCTGSYCQTTGKKTSVHPAHPPSHLSHANSHVHLPSAALLAATIDLLSVNGQCSPLPGVGPASPSNVVSTPIIPIKLPITHLDIADPSAHSSVPGSPLYDSQDSCSKEQADNAQLFKVHINCCPFVPLPFPTFVSAPAFTPLSCPAINYQPALLPTYSSVRRPPTLACKWSVLSYASQKFSFTQSRYLCLAWHTFPLPSEL